MTTVADGSRGGPARAFAERLNDLRILDNVATDMEQDAIDACNRAMVARRKYNALRRELYDPGNEMALPVIRPSWLPQR